MLPLLLLAINLGTVTGIDCSGKTDSSAALNTVFQHITSQKVVIPSGCQIRADAPIVIQGQESFAIEGEGDRPTIPRGPSIFGCNGAAGALLTINRSGFWTLRGFGIFAKGDPICYNSNFTQSLAIDNSGSGGFTTTHGVIEHMGFSVSVQGSRIDSYIGVNIVGHPNTEHMVLRDNWIHCHSSVNSIGIQVYGVNSDNDLSDGNSISSCYHGIRQNGGNIRMVNNHFNANGNFSVFGANGAAIFVSYCPSGPVFIAYNEASGGGPFINSNFDTNGGCLRGMNIIGNIVGISDIGPNQYPLNIGTANVPYVVMGNDFYITPTKTTKSVIGSDSQSGCKYGPVGALIDIGNTNSYPGNTGGWSGCVGGPDFQRGHFEMGSYDSGMNGAASKLKVTPGLNDNTGTIQGTMVH